MCMLAKNPAVIAMFWNLYHPAYRKMMPETTLNMNIPV
jgi:hypothetical protein